MTRLKLKTFIKHSNITFGKLDNTLYSNGEINPIVYLTADGIVETVGKSVIKYSDQENTYLVFENTGCYIAVIKEQFRTTILEYEQIKDGLHVLIVNDYLTSLPLIIKNNCSIKLDKKAYSKRKESYMKEDIPIATKILAKLVLIACIITGITITLVLLMNILNKIDLTQIIKV